MARDGSGKIDFKELHKALNSSHAPQMRVLPSSNAPRAPAQTAAASPKLSTTPSSSSATPAASAAAMLAHAPLLSPETPRDAAGTRRASSGGLSSDGREDEDKGADGNGLKADGSGRVLTGTPTALMLKGMPPPPSSRSPDVLLSQGAPQEESPGADAYDQWARMLETTHQSASLEAKLLGTQAELQTALKRQNALQAVGEQLVSQVDQMKAQIDTFMVERETGVMQIASLARAASLAEKKVAEREETIKDLERKLASSESAREMEALREENAELLSMVKLLSLRIYKNDPTIGANPDVGTPQDESTRDGKGSKKSPGSRSTSPQLAATKSRYKSATDKWINESKLTLGKSP
eukprot:CAMPEP_0174746100 /NCGR_PEP_ID=MMETSP1094-20130205/88338_1 /TAXON_ID=156173 /ORGANISM="Chrysochromulina brevifilum, Strain UTEX LB 985" /LENGTH=351 /DNA_ID=CAMNT_0015950763 /DNA_START=1 /DNA_END=1056 /DNA_ORIENTATION=+